MTQTAFGMKDSAAQSHFFVGAELHFLLPDSDLW